MTEKNASRDTGDMKPRKKVTTVLGVFLAIAGLLGMAIFVYPVFRGSRINIGTVLGLGAFLMAFIYGCFWRMINAWIKKLWSRKAGRISLSVLLACAVILLALVSVITAHMVYAAHVKPYKDATVVVLGCAVRNGGPSLMLRERLDAAERYLSDNPDAFCVVSGGQGSDESISEAQCMYEYLTAHGVDGSRIYMEDQSVSTRENIKFSARIIKENNLPEKMNIVTNEFHEYRAKKIADRQGIETASIAGGTAWWLLPTYYVREMVGILYEWISG